MTWLPRRERTTPSRARRRAHYRPHAYELPASLLRGARLFGHDLSGDRCPFPHARYFAVRWPQECQRRHRTATDGAGRAESILCNCVSGARVSTPSNRPVYSHTLFQPQSCGTRSSVSVRATSQPTARRVVGERRRRRRPRLTRSEKRGRAWIWSSDLRNIVSASAP